MLLLRGARAVNTSTGIASRCFSSRKRRAPANTRRPTHEATSITSPQQHPLNIVHASPSLPNVHFGGLTTSSTPAAALLAHIRAVVPERFLKTSTAICRHKRILHSRLLNGLSLRGTLSGASASSRKHEELSDQSKSGGARIAADAVQAMQRTDAIVGLARAFADRAALRFDSDGPIDRQCNPHTAYFGAPGSGKTTVLELAAELTTRQAWSDELCHDPAMRAALNASIAVTVTYNSGMDADVDGYDDNPKSGLALRVLFSALIQDDTAAYSFGDFWLDWIQRNDTLPVPLSLQLAIDTCVLAFSELAPCRTGVLLLIDETRKLAESFQRKTGHNINNEANRVYDMLAAVGGALDANPSAVFNVACTTLDVLMLKTASTSSGRKIQWVSLDGLRQPAAEAMLMCALGRPFTSRVPALVSLSVADCARHPRSLVLLERALFQRARERGPVDWFYNPGELKKIRLIVSSSMSEVLPLWAVQAALNGTALPFDEVVSGSGGVKFNDAIAKGVFHNAIETDDRISSAVPRISFMNLLRAAGEDGVLRGAIRDAILSMSAHEEAAFDTPRASGMTPFGGTVFEGFLCSWLKLRFALAAASSRALSVQELFGLEFGDKVSRSARLSLGRGLVVSGSPAETVFFPHVALPLVSFAEAVSDCASRNLIDEVIASGGGVITFSANNPGFDILLLVREARAVGEGAAAPLFHAVAIEARFSSPTSKLRTSAKDVEDKFNLFFESLVPHGAFEQLGIPSDRVSYVFMASRLDKSASESNQKSLQRPEFSVVSSLEVAAKEDRSLNLDERAAFLNKGIVIVDRAGVERALTPSLADRAFFLLS